MGTFKVIIIYNLYNGMYGDECGYNGYNGLDLLGKVHTAKIMALLPPKCVGISSFFFFSLKELARYWGNHMSSSAETGTGRSLRKLSSGRPGFRAPFSTLVGLHPSKATPSADGAAQNLQDLTCQ